MTSETLCDRVRSLVTAAPFAYVESPQPWDFDAAPTGVGTDDVVRFLCAETQTRGGFSRSEEVYAELEVSILRRYDGDVGAVQRSLLTSAQSVVSSVVTDSVAGDYGVLDEGRACEVTAPEGAGYAVGRVRIPITFLRTI